MGYGRTGYQRGYQRSRSISAGRVSRVNKRPGECRACGETIPAGAGELYREASGTWSVVHTEARWAGSPVSGHYVGGCPESTDKLNAGAHVKPEAERLAAVAATWAASSPVQEERVHYGYTRNGRRRCEDAPCCGCCD